MNELMSPDYEYHTITDKFLAVVVCFHRMKKVCPNLKQSAGCASFVYIANRGAEEHHSTLGICPYNPCVCKLRSVLVHLNGCNILYIPYSNNNNNTFY